MNYLIVLSRFVKKSGDSYFFPLGIAYVSSSLKKAGKNVVTLNLNQTDSPVSEVIENAINEHGIDVVLTGGLSGNYNRVKDIVRASRKAKEDIISVVGGGLVSSEPFVAMEGLSADIGVIGEGEITVCELAEALEKGSDLAGIDGLIYRKNGQFHTTGVRKENRDLASISWPDYEGFGFSAYLDAISKIPGNGRYASMIASRSCPFHCTFCYHSSGKVYRQRTLDDLFQEIDYMLSHFRIDHLSICDELFSAKQDRIEDFCGGMKERMKRYRLRWDIQLRVESVNRDLLRLLKASDCKVISYGIESADNRVLKSMRKNITVEQIENALRLTREAEIEIQGNFIFGDIEETWETVNNTLEWWSKHLEYQINLTNIRVFPGTHLYKYACEHGIIKDKLKYLEDNCPLINVSKMNEGEFNALEEKIQNYLKKYSYTPDAIEVVDISGSGCHLSLVCGKCKGRSEQVYSLLAQTLYAQRVVCPHCRERMDLDDAFTNQVFTGLFQDCKRVAVWGCGDVSQKLFEKSKSLRENCVFLVDNDVQKQGGNFCGHKVVSPSRILDEKIDTIIIASIMYADEISNEIADKYPGVSKIIKLTDMGTIYNE